MAASHCGKTPAVLLPFVFKSHKKQKFMSVNVRKPKMSLSSGEQLEYYGFFLTWKSIFVRYLTANRKYLFNTEGSFSIVTSRLVCTNPMFTCKIIQLCLQLRFCNHQVSMRIVTETSKTCPQCV